MTEAPEIAPGQIWIPTRLRSCAVGPRTILEVTPTYVRYRRMYCAATRASRAAWHKWVDKHAAVVSMAND
jgi:hypothetical protein